MSIQMLSNAVLLISSIVILTGSLFLTWKLRFIQLRLFSTLFQILCTKQKKSEAKGMISPLKALFTAMSTTLGISTIVAPVIAIHLGGPGALFGFLLVSFFGSAATYVEVNLSLLYRKKLSNGTIMGGPMQYLKELFSPALAKWYAVCCLILMSAWSSAQANQLAAILNSPLLGSYRIPTAISGAFIALLVLLILMGGIKRIGSISAKLVPIMFSLYLGSILWILALNFDKLGGLFSLMWQSLLSPYEMASGALVGGLFTALRWGVFKGSQTSEAGIGTQAIPHSMAETNDPKLQATLAMLSTYTAGFVAFLSGCVALLTGTWEDPSLPLGISMVAVSFSQYFSLFGIGVIAISALLFGFGTILGNSYNGSECFRYLSNHQKGRYYLFGTAIMIFIGAISDVKTVWSLIDLVLIGVAIPHMLALVVYTQKHSYTLLAKPLKRAPQNT